MAYLTRRYLDMTILEIRNKLKEDTEGRIPDSAKHLAQLRYILKFRHHPNLQFYSNVSFESLSGLLEQNGEISFDSWVHNREAHHLIPESLSVRLGISKALINSTDNSIMLVSGRIGKQSASQNYQDYQTRKYEHGVSSNDSQLLRSRKPKLNEPFHVGCPNDFHNSYNRFVERYFLEVSRNYPGLSTEALFYMVASDLRGYIKKLSVSYVEELGLQSSY